MDKNKKELDELSSPYDFKAYIVNAIRTTILKDDREPKYYF